MPKDLAGFIACVGIALLIYVRTLAPGVYTFDSAEFATGAYVLGIIHSTGYPFYLLLAKLFTYLPIGDDIAYRVNLMSAVWGAVTAGLLFLLCRRLTGHRGIAAAVALLFAFSHYFWPAAVIAETYTLNTTLVLVLLLLLTSDQVEQRPALGGFAGLAFGLALANHMSSILLTLPLAYWGIVRRARPAAIVPFAAAALAGLAFYLYLPLRYAADPPLNYAKTYFDVDLTTLPGLMSWMTGEMFRQFMAGYEPVEVVGEIARYAGWLWSNFLGAGVVVGLVGIYETLRRDRRLAMLFLLTYFAYIGFFINYRVVNKDTMFNVSYLVWSVWIAYGASAVHAWVTGHWPGLPRARALAVPALMGVLAALSLALNYAWADQSSNRMAKEFASGLHDHVEPSAFIVTEWTWATPLEYMQIVEGRRPDVTVFDRGLYGLAVWNRARKQGLADAAAANRIETVLAERIQSEIRTRPVYATSPDDALTPYFDFIPLSNYFKLVPRSGPTPP